ncbi:hypothetical protein Agabi119p4_10364 [Agaricus bisporus var. burnettii]|uniref:Uncharacterized protein n=1 Tax=Agaricus bisporus var. burnettii TaxID=192524 RepID=A0A8H7C2R8_AGABI|nr:hypothetical protein Agabi119p4_10364 [Agaricus bisporus var. burnettii]
MEQMPALMKEKGLLQWRRLHVGRHQGQYDIGFLLKDLELQGMRPKCNLKDDHGLKTLLTLTHVTTSRRRKHSWKTHPPRSSISVLGGRPCAHPLLKLSVTCSNAKRG